MRTIIQRKAKPMDTPYDRFNDTVMDFIDRSAHYDPASDDATTAIKNIKELSQIQFKEPKPELTPARVPTTRWEKVKAATSKIWDNETTRVLIKAGGAFAGVGLVTYTTIHRDHVLQREALAQANQRSI